MQTLCGTDFSPNATDAVNAAAAVARRFKDRLQVVHAGGALGSRGLQSPAADNLSALLDAQRAALAQAGVPVETRLVGGSPLQALTQLAAPGQTRMIVLSSIGQVALARAVLGSTADRVAESATVPTLVVRSAAPFNAWARKNRALRILIATDGSAASHSALAFVKTWIEAGPATLLLGHVSGPGNTQSPGDLAELAKSLLGPKRPRLQVVHGQAGPAEALIALAREHRADLLVTGSHQRRGVRRLWRQSVSRALLADAPMSVAVVPVPPEGPPQPVRKIRRILVTTDLSPAGNRALQAACALLPSGGVLRILHVLPAAAAGFSLLGGNPGVPALSPGERKVRQRTVASRLRCLVPAEAAAGSIVADPVAVESDDIPGAIVSEARRFGAQAICMTTHGRSGTLRFLAGSVTQSVLQTSPIPVHLVPPLRD